MDFLAVGIDDANADALRSDLAVETVKMAVDQDGEGVLVAVLARSRVNVFMVMPADHHVHAGIIEDGQQDRKSVV